MDEQRRKFLLNLPEKLKHAQESSQVNEEDTFEMAYLQKVNLK